MACTLKSTQPRYWPVQIIIRSTEHYKKHKKHTDQVEQRAYHKDLQEQGKPYGSGKISWDFSDGDGSKSV